MKLIIFILVLSLFKFFLCLSFDVIGRLYAGKSSFKNNSAVYFPLDQHTEEKDLFFLVRIFKGHFTSNHIYYGDSDSELEIIHMYNHIKNMKFSTDNFHGDNNDENLYFKIPNTFKKEYLYISFPNFKGTSETFVKIEKTYLYEVIGELGKNCAIDIFTNKKAVYLDLDKFKGDKYLYFSVTIYKGAFESNSNWRELYNNMRYRFLQQPDHAMVNLNREQIFFDSSSGDGFKYNDEFTFYFKINIEGFFYFSYLYISPPDFEGNSDTYITVKNINAYEFNK